MSDLLPLHVMKLMGYFFSFKKDQTMLNKPKSKPILRSERQAKIKARNQKLSNHINQGISNYVNDVYNDHKEARKNARWYETGEAIKDAIDNANHDADAEFLEEFASWAEKEQEEYYAELDAKEQAMLMAEDDVIDVEYQAISPRRKERKSLLGSSRPNLLSSVSEVKSLPSSRKEETDAATPNPFQSDKRPK